MPDRMDYPANRGPLDRQEYTKRRPDPFSILGGLFGCLIIGAFIIGTVLIVGWTLLAELRFLLGG